ncbi:MAG: Hsp20/alpha crystallin family protein [Alphaproteobacteria bacterium]
MLEVRTPALATRPGASLRETWSGDPLAAFKREVDRLFDGFFDDVTPEIGSFQPRLDVRETDEHVLIAADLPGVAPENLDLNVEGDLLTLSGRREENAEDDRQGWYRRERVFGRFERAIRLPFEIGDDAVEAKYDHGVLNVRVAKPEGHRSRVRRIPITHQGG